MCTISMKMREMHSGEPGILNYSSAILVQTSCQESHLFVNFQCILSVLAVRRGSVKITSTMRRIITACQHLLFCHHVVCHHVVGQQHPRGACWLCLMQVWQPGQKRDYLETNRCTQYGWSISWKCSWLATNGMQGQANWVSADQGMP